MYSLIFLCIIAVILTLVALVLMLIAAHRFSRDINDELGGYALIVFIISAVTILVMCTVIYDKLTKLDNKNASIERINNNAGRTRRISATERINYKSCNNDFIGSNTSLC